ncbi:MAG: cell envelope integrity protein CreD [Deltaproteobacteria bacterium]|jgi:inner membrane protein|nr:cell envelope integrity protein CreD [Deltaproteobacteria bacterium]
MENIMIWLCAMVLAGMVVGLTAGAILLWRRVLRNGVGKPFVAPAASEAQNGAQNETTGEPTGQTTGETTGPAQAPCGIPDPAPSPYGAKAQPGPGGRIAWKLAAIAAMSLALAIPLQLAKDLAKEREKRHGGVIRGLAEEWGGHQTLSGPFLAVPVTFTRTVTEKTPLGGPRRGSGDGQEDGQAYGTVYREVTETGLAIMAARRTLAEGTFALEERKRGIFSSKVYLAKFRLVGDFELPGRDELARLAEGKTLKDVDWAGARLVVGLSDTAAIKRVGELTLGGKGYGFRPGGSGSGGLPAGFSAPVSLSGGEGLVPFSLDLDFGGSGAFNLAPSARDTELSVSSDWPHPSFRGGLPVEREVGEKGFAAKWTVPDLVHAQRGLSLAEKPQPGEESDPYGGEGEGQYLLGVDFIEPVDDYLLIERACKFGLMFIALTFLILLICDPGPGAKAGRGLHPLQYGMVGLALVLFYVVLLSLSEHVGFDLAYLLAAAINVLMIGGYSAAATRGSRRGLLIAALTAVLYAALYVILRQEDLALLYGAGVLVTVMIALMALTRRVNR